MKLFSRLAVSDNKTNVRQLCQVVKEESLRGEWDEGVLSNLVPLLLTALSVEDVALDHKYRIGCFFQSLGKFPDFSRIIENRVLPVVSELKNSSAKLKVRLKTGT